MHFDILRLNNREKMKHHLTDHGGFSTLTEYCNEITFSIIEMRMLYN